MDSNNNIEKAKWEPPLIKQLDFKLTNGGEHEEWPEDLTDGFVDQPPS